MLKVGILGANGFIGSRTFEMFHLGGLSEVRAIVRQWSDIALASRFDAECHIADACNQSALRAAFVGCDVIVHAIAGDRKAILGSLYPTYRAAQEAGVRRLIYLSTASVHGQVPSPNTDESSPLKTNHQVPYNNLKVQAEWILRNLRKKGQVELVMLRPGIVFGPRSRWISSFAESLMTGEAGLLNRGKGICNSIYIDNLGHAIYLALSAPHADGEAFLVGDQECVTWADLYRPIAEALGFNLDDIPEGEIEGDPSAVVTYLQKFRHLKVVQSAMALLPKKIRWAAFNALNSWMEGLPPTPWERPDKQEPVISKEMALLYQCQYQFPFEKARKILGYKPVVSFPEACRRTIGWLEFAGYPVVNPSKGQYTEWTSYG